MKVNFIIFLLKIFIIAHILNLTNEMDFFPEKFYQDDLIIPDNDKVDEYQYNLIEAKVLTEDYITLYIKKQGIILDKDDCCEGYKRFDAWENNVINKDISDLEEIYSHAVYTESTTTITTISYKFPVSRIEHEDYTLYHKVYIFDKNKGNPSCNIYFSDGNVNSQIISVDLLDGKYFVILTINYNKVTSKNIVKCNGQNRVKWRFLYFYNKF